MNSLRIRSTDASRNLDVLLAFAVAGVLANRFFLVLTGYPQLGGGTLHISHAIWGGLMMVVAIAVAVSTVSPAVRLFVAFLGGAGFGWFVDELGKFITRDVNYFFKPTLAIIYLVFIAMYLAFRSIQRAPYKPEEALLNGLEALKSAALGRLDEHTRQDAVRLIDESGHPSALAVQVRELLADADTRAPKRSGLGARASQKLQEVTERWAGHPRFAYVFAGVFLALSLSDVAQMVYYATYGPGLHSVTEWAITISSVLTFALAAIGAWLIHRSRLRAYWWFERSILVALLITQVFLFHEAQLAGILDLTVTLAVWLCLRSAMRVERERAAAAPIATEPAPA